ncbi:MAG: hypothetical protein JNL01_12885 [Bdellovibrionales bacterium]|nr:hypothetical protein [Bdellovibrionales bacterium]
MARIKTQKMSEQPTLSPEKAVNLLKRQLQRLDSTLQLRHDDPEFTAWKNTTVNVLHGAFGRPNGEAHKNTTDFERTLGGVVIGMPDHKWQERHVENQNRRKALLAAYIEQLQDLVPFEPNKISDDNENSLRQLCRRLSRFHLFARALRKRHNSRSTLEMEDEYDVQDAVKALLKLDFDDVRAEESTPSYAGQGSRMDFLLKRENTVIEIKKTRKGLGDKELGEELIQDVARYKVHPDCKRLICFIYDPENRIGNPSGLKSDLEKFSTSEIIVNVVISPE